MASSLHYLIFNKGTAAKKWRITKKNINVNKAKSKFVFFFTYRRWIQIWLIRKQNWVSQKLFFFLLTVLKKNSFYLDHKKYARSHIVVLLYIIQYDPFWNLNIIQTLPVQGSFCLDWGQHAKDSLNFHGYFCVWGGALGNNTIRLTVAVHTYTETGAHWRSWAGLIRKTLEWEDAVTTFLW